MQSKKNQSAIESNNAFMVKMEDLVREIIIQNNIPFYRIESVMEHRPSENEAEATYMPIVRVITYFEDSVNKVSDILSTEFDVVKQKPKDKKKTMIEGYSEKQMHFIASLKQARLQLIEYKRSGNKKFEILVCSMLQDAWSGIERELGYQSVNVPEDMQRDFYRVGALLEMADLEFLKIRSLLGEFNNSAAKSDVKSTIVKETPPVAKQTPAKTPPTPPQGAKPPVPGMPPLPPGFPPYPPMMPNGQQMPPYMPMYPPGYGYPGYPYMQGYPNPYMYQQGYPMPGYPAPNPDPNADPQQPNSNMPGYPPYPQMPDWQGQNASAPVDNLPTISFDADSFASPQTYTPENFPDSNSSGQEVVMERFDMDINNLAGLKTNVNHIDKINAPEQQLLNDLPLSINAPDLPTIEELENPINTGDLNAEAPASSGGGGQEGVALNIDKIENFNMNVNGVIETRTEVLIDKSAEEKNLPFYELEDKINSNANQLDENAQMTDETLRGYVFKSRLVKEVDAEIARRAGATLNNDVDVEGDVERLRFLKVYSLKQLHERITDNKNDIIAFAEKWIGKDNGGSFDMGICLFYLEYLLVGKRNDPAFAVEYVLKFISDNDYSARFIIPTYNAISKNEQPIGANLTMK